MFGLLGFIFIYTMGSFGMLLWILSKEGKEYTNDIPKHEKVISVLSWWMIIEACLVFRLIALAEESRGKRC